MDDQTLARATSGPPTPVEVSTDSGSYVRVDAHTLASIRLDVDGRHPQMMVSGTSLFFTEMVHWIGNLQVASGAHHWMGSIWYKDGDTAAFAYTDVDVQVTRNSYGPVSATVALTGRGASSKRATYAFKSPYFRNVEFEFDSVAGTKAVVSMFTADHPDRPASLPHEILNLKLVYQRAGFDVKQSGGDDIVPLDGAIDEAWSDLELHDAMQVYWSHFAPKAQWSAWVLFAGLHEKPPGPWADVTDVGGTMFDDDNYDPQHRQGCAIFVDSFISEAPPGDPNPEAWVRRERFWTAAHEMGHTFNLAHAWQKAVQPGSSWIPLSNELDALSFMNYPHYYPLGYYQSDGQVSEFFQQFEYRFSDSELLFMRHAPTRFVQQGNALWFDQHGFEGANVRPWSPYQLQLRVNRERPVFEFMEPAVVELKLTNVSSEPALIPKMVLVLKDGMLAAIRKDGSPARQFLPYARHCVRERRRVLAAGESVYGSLFLGAGRNGWDLAEPGNYTIQVALPLDGEHVVSNPLRVRVTPPRGYDEEVLAQEFFSNEVGRILTFGGSVVLTKGNAVLREVTERLPDSRAAVHARIALGNAVAVEHKRLDLGGKQGGPAVPAHMAGGRIVTVRPDVGEARRHLSTALAGESNIAAETLGHIGYTERAIAFADWLVHNGAVNAAAELLTTGYQTLSQRGVPQGILEDMKRRRDEYGRGDR